MANQPSKHWGGGAADDLMAIEEHWSVADYDIAEAVAALIGAFWGIQVTIV